MKKLLVIFLSAALLFSLASCGSVGTGSKKVTSPALIASFTTYTMEDGSEDWNEQSKTVFKYENGYPSEITFTDAEGNDEKDSFQYEFKDGLPISMKKLDAKGKLLSGMTYSDGIPAEAVFFDANGKEEQKFSLEYEDGFVSSLLSAKNDSVTEAVDDVTSFFSVENCYYDMFRGLVVCESNAFTVESKDGLLRKTSNSMRFAVDFTVNDDLYWGFINGSLCVDYDDDGIINSTYVENGGKDKNDESYFVVKTENGRISEIEKYVLSAGEQEAVPVKKYVFEYTDVEIDAARYANMINSCATDNDISYYVFPWY